MTICSCTSARRTHSPVFSCNSRIDTLFMCLSVTQQLYAVKQRRLSDRGHEVGRVHPGGCDPPATCVKQLNQESRKRLKRQHRDRFLARSAPDSISRAVAAEEKQSNRKRYANNRDVNPRAAMGMF